MTYEEYMDQDESKLPVGMVTVGMLSDALVKPLSEYPEGESRERILKGIGLVLLEEVVLTVPIEFQDRFRADLLEEFELAESA